MLTNDKLIKTIVAIMGRPNKGQHKVPRTYLEAFTNTSGKVWVSDSDLRLYQGKPKEVLTEKDYYTIKFHSGQGSLVIETEVLGGIETAYSNIYRNKLSQHKPLIDEERAIMAIFIASMLNRSPRIRNTMDDFFKRVTNHMDIMEETVANMTELEKQALIDYQPIHDRENSISGSDMRELAKDVPSLHSSGIPYMIRHTAPIIYDMMMNYMVRPKGSEPFVTSDSPAVLVNPDLPPKSFYGPGLAQNSVEISLPLSPDLVILAGWKMHQDGVYIPVDSSSVDEINRRTMRAAEILISNDKTMLERQITRIQDYKANHPSGKDYT